MESIRIDKYLWAIRVFKTRTLATKACNAGKVKINGDSVKPSYLVKAGEHIDARVHYKVRKLQVVKIIAKRVSASIAQECYIDNTPADQDSIKQAAFYSTERRDRGSGRPTKKERREIKEFKEEDLEDWEEW